MGTSVQVQENKSSCSCSCSVETETGGAKHDKKDEGSNVLYFKVDNLTRLELETAVKKKVVVNEEEIALISHNNKIYAVEEKCPHSGGPLHEGDIEDLPGNLGFCVRCPWHGWKFNLETGQCVFPKNRDYRFLKTFPVRLDPTGQFISLGFDKISPKIFSQPPP